MQPWAWESQMGNVSGSALELPNVLPPQRYLLRAKPDTSLLLDPEFMAVPRWAASLTDVRDAHLTGISMTLLSIRPLMVALAGALPLIATAQTAPVAKLDQIVVTPSRMAQPLKKRGG